jgi:hypothetical protein
MRKKEPGRMATAGAAALLALTVLMGACTPGNEITAAESDIAITTYDETYDFGAVTTWAMPDSVIQITDPDDPQEISRQFDALILSEIEDQMTARGYQRLLPEDDPGLTNPPDVVVVVSVTTADTYYLYSYYPWYGWWGGWGWYYPGYYPPYYGATYAYSTGTIIVSMAEPDDLDPETETILSVWTGALNGVSNDTGASVSQRITRGIEQLFTQSPYLKSRG